MINFIEHLRANGVENKTWLILGKGPSFIKLKEFDCSGFVTVSLNHVITELHVDYSHVIDIDVVGHCAESIYSNARFLVLPLYPHVENRSTNRKIGDFFVDYPVLKRLDEEGRLIWYNASTSVIADNDFPIIPVRYFSADAMIALLAYSGVRDIRTLGVDGGKSYCGAFNDLRDKTLLANGQPSFDLQFRAIAKTLKNTGARMIPMTMAGPVKVYVGSQKEQMIAVKVLEYSIKKNASCSVDVFPMHLSGIAVPMPRDPKNKPRTPFSFQRFMIPELNDYVGKAIYLDSDMQVFCDIRDLWERQFSSGNVLSAWLEDDSARQPQFSVMLLNCDELKWSVKDVIAGLDEGKYSYEELMYNMVVANVETAIEPEWNSLEMYCPGKTKLVHYTDMHEQPWLNRSNKLASVWMQELAEAVSEGFVTMDEIKNSIVKQEIRPSIYFELHLKNCSKKKLDFICRFVDQSFIPPHARLSKSKRDNVYYWILRRVVAAFIKFRDQ